MAATHIRITADLPLSKERKFSTVHKAIDPALRAWHEAVEAEGGVVEMDMISVPKRKTPTPPPGTPAAPTVDLVQVAELGTAVEAAAAPPAPGTKEGRRAA